MPALKRQTVPVSSRALIQRINRKLAAEGKRLVANRGEQAQREFGAYSVVSGRPGHIYIEDSGFDLEKYGRKLGAIKEWESLAKG